MINSNFDLQGNVIHECKSVREGDWAIFTCSKCSDYIRKINLVTGEMIAPNSNNTIRHNGSYVLYGLQPDIYSSN